MRLNGKPTTRLLFSTIDADEATRRHPLWHPAAACLWAASTFHRGSLRWQHAALYGNFKTKPWPRPRCTNCWMDRDCYHDSRATETCPSFQHLLPSQLLIQPECKFSLHWVFITSYRILLISLSWWILGMLKMTIIRHRCQLSSTSFKWTLHTEFNKHICWKLNCWIQN